MQCPQGTQRGLQRACGGTNKKEAGTILSPHQRHGWQLCWRTLSSALPHPTSPCHSISASQCSSTSLVSKNREVWRRPLGPSSPTIKDQLVPKQPPLEGFPSPWLKACGLHGLFVCLFPEDEPEGSVEAAHPPPDSGGRQIKGYTSWEIPKSKPSRKWDSLG